MLGLEFYDVVRRRRSVRRFHTDGEVGDGVVRRLVEAACLAPSAGNSQPWRFIIVRDRVLLRRLAEVNTLFSRLAWEAFDSGMARDLASRGGRWDKGYVAELPAVIVVCYGAGVRSLPDELILASTWCAIENMLLAATAEELGSCPYTLFRGEEKAVKELFEIPNDYRIACIIHVGHTLDMPKPPPKRKVEKIIGYNRFPKNR
ncbi:MAG: nitroreductase family protein [Candidatus Bathyarchaeia archaeon]